MIVQMTGPQQQQQTPWNPQRQDGDGDTVAAVVEDVKLAEPLRHTAGHHLSDGNPLSNMTYSTIKRHNKHKNIETTLRRSRYILDVNTRNTLELVSSLDTLTLTIPEELAMLTETSPTPGALKKWELDYKKREEQREIFHNFLASFYALIWGQCTLVLCDKL